MFYRPNKNKSTAQIRFAAEGCFISKLRTIFLIKIFAAKTTTVELLGQKLDLVIGKAYPFLAQSKKKRPRKTAVFFFNHKIDLYFGPKGGIRLYQNISTYGPHNKQPTRESRENFV